MSIFATDVNKLLGIQLSSDQLAAFDRYAAELVEWNQRFNLTNIIEPQQILTKHFLDSLSCWLAMRDYSPGPVIDVGTGAGFPGVPLKILQPDLQLTLVEATAKKAGFLEHLVQVLRLEGVRVVASRAEDVGQISEHRAFYDWAIARAVAPMAVLAEYLLPLVRVGGYALAQKGRDAKLEVDQAEVAIQVLGGDRTELIPVVIPGLEEERWLVKIQKMNETPAEYPRKPGRPSKRPLG